ncbi:hypothetical protein DENSPDRAFT_928566 [Dentipellis sp. KUC8613]|nr:hypothetical protein DENSPDRAFT_928566 [Dentipellis sp. KUC8613]
METARGSSAMPHAPPLFVAPWHPQLLTSFTLSHALLFAPSRPSCPLHAVALLAPSRSLPHRAPCPIALLTPSRSSPRHAPLGPSRTRICRRPFVSPVAPPSRPSSLCTAFAPLRAAFTSFHAAFASLAHPSRWRHGGATDVTAAGVAMRWW